MRKRIKLNAYTPRYVYEWAWDIAVDWWVYGGQHRRMINEFYWGSDLPKAT